MFAGSLQPLPATCMNVLLGVVVVPRNRWVPETPSGPMCPTSTASSSTLLATTEPRPFSMNTKASVGSLASTRLNFSGKSTCSKWGARAAKASGGNAVRRRLRNVDWSIEDIFSPLGEEPDLNAGSSHCSGNSELMRYSLLGGDGMYDFDRPTRRLIAEFW